MGPTNTCRFTVVAHVFIMAGGSISEEETAASMKIIFPDRTNGFQIDAGVEAFGRGSLNFAKQSFRLSFKELYRPPKLNFDLTSDGKLDRADLERLDRRPANAVWRRKPGWPGK